MAIPLKDQSDAPSVDRERLARELLAELEHVKDLVSLAIEPVAPNEGLQEKVNSLEAQRERLLTAKERAEHELARVQEQLGRTMNLYVATYQLHLHLDPTLVQQTIAEITINLLGAQSFAVILRDPRSGQCRVTMTEGDSVPLPTGQQPYEGGDPMIDEALLDGRVSLEPRVGSTALAAVPLRISDTTVGALVIYQLLNQRPMLRESDQDLLDLLAAHAATALLAAQVYNQTDSRLRTIEGLVQLKRGPESDGEVSFTGRIEHLQVPELLQFLQFGGRDGTLVLRPGNEEGRIVIRGGRVVGAQAPGEPGLGARLVKLEVLSPGALMWAEKQAKDGGNLGESLARLVPQSLLTKAARAQISESTRILLTWDEGTFEFRPNEDDLTPVMGVSDRVLGDEASFDIQNLVLDSLRMIDEESYGGGPKPVIDLDSAFAPSFSETPESTGDQPSSFGEELINEMDAELNDLDLNAPENAETPDLVNKLRTAIGAVRTSLQHQSVAVQLLDILSSTADRGVLFVVHRDKLTPIGAFGQSRGGRPLAEIVSQLTPPRVTGGLAEVLDTQSSRLISFSSLGFPEDFASALGAPAHPDVVLVPIFGYSRPIVLAYGDNGSKNAAPAGLDFLDLMATPIGLALENELLRRRLAKA